MQEGIAAKLPRIGQHNESVVDQSRDAGKESQSSDRTQFLSALIPFDYASIGILLLLLYPAFRWARLPLQIDVKGMAVNYWLGTVLLGASCSVVLAIIGLPLERTLMPYLRRCQKQKERIVLSFVLAALMSCVFGLWLGSIIAINTLCAAELWERDKPAIAGVLFAIFLPALYLFCVLILDSAFNHAIAGIRSAETCDAVLAHWDQLLFHFNTANIALWSLGHLSPWVLRLMDIVYYGLFGGIAAGVFLTSLLRDQQYAMKYVRTLFVCYILGLAVFLVLPAKGPYATHILNLPNRFQGVLSYLVQGGLVMRERMLWAHTLTPEVTVIDLRDFYISFPSLHVALPIVTIWFLRPWKRIALLLLSIYVMLLLPSIIILGWHYLIDYLGGFVDASLAVWLTEQVSRKSCLKEERRMADVEQNA